MGRPTVVAHSNGPDDWSTYMHKPNRTTILPKMYATWQHTIPNNDKNCITQDNANTHTHTHSCCDPILREAATMRQCTHGMDPSCLQCSRTTSPESNDATAFLGLRLLYGIAATKRFNWYMSDNIARINKTCICSENNSRQHARSTWIMPILTNKMHVCNINMTGITTRNTNDIRNCRERTFATVPTLKWQDLNMLGCNRSLKVSQHIKQVQWQRSNEFSTNLY